MATEQQRVELGARVRDDVTGFEGIVVARTEWLHDLPGVGVQAQGCGRNGKPIEVAWINEGRLRTLNTTAEVLEELARDAQ